MEHVSPNETGLIVRIQCEHGTDGLVWVDLPTDRHIAVKCYAVPTM